MIEVMHAMVNLMRVSAAVFAAVFLALLANSMIFKEDSIPHIDMRLTASAPADSEVVCPPGWEADNAPTLDHVSRRCLRDPWIVFLYPTLDAANYGKDTSNPILRDVPCLEIPKWPASWCVAKPNE